MKILYKICLLDLSKKCRQGAVSQRCRTILWLCSHVIFPLLRDVRSCYQHCDVRNELKNIKNFEATEFIPKEAIGFQE